jgi:hypothetical protein
MAERRYPGFVGLNGVLYGVLAVVLGLTCIFVKAGLGPWVPWAGAALVLLGVVGVVIGFRRWRRRA